MKLRFSLFLSSCVLLAPASADKQKSSRLRPRNLQGGEEFYIVNVANGKVADVSGAQCADATNIHLWTRNGTPAQRFTFGSNDSIVNVGCNKVLDVSGANCDSGTNIHLYRPNGTGAQRFRVRSDGAIENTACGKVIDVNGNEQADGTNIHLWTWNGSGAQVWRIEYVNGGSPPAPAPAPPPPINPVPPGPTGTQSPWQGPFKAPLIGAAAAALPDGRVLLWSAFAKYSFGGASGFTWTSIFDPNTKAYTETLISNTGHDMFCPGLAFLGDGNLMVTGGSNSEKTSLYNAQSNSWGNSDNMNIPRGYHTMATLGTGEVFAIGGSWSGGEGNKNGEVWYDGKWYLKSGVLSDALVTADVTPKNRDYFMWIFQAPNGRIFKAGPSKMMHWIDIAGNGSFEEAGLRSDDGDAMNGNPVMYDIGKILCVGGSADFESGVTASERSYVIDINGNTAIATRSGDMTWKRTFANSVALPSGEVVVIGGKTNAVPFSDANAVFEAEIWNPSTGRWTTLQRMQVPRVYHATALLMQDATILAAGGGLCGTCAANHDDAEIFTPPYLFNPDGSLATRPVIQEAPTNISPGDTIDVTMDNNDSGTTFALMRTCAVTHSTDMGQRRVPVAVQDIKGNTFELSIPANQNVVLPGVYFLFAMNSAGTPSVGSTMYVGNGQGGGGHTNNEFYIVNAATNRVLDVAGGDCATGTNIHLWTRNGTPAQLFRFGSNGSIINVGCNKAIDISQAQCDNGSNIQLWDINGTPAQEWDVNERTGAITNPTCNKVIDMQGNVNADGTNIHIYAWNGSGAQIWNIEFVN